MEKQEIREYVIKLRKSLTYDTKDLQQKLVERLKSLKNIAVYYPMLGEIDVTFLRWYGFDLCYPESFGKEIRFRKNPTEWRISDLGVHEPINGDYVEIKDIDAAIVPGLVFDKDGYRVGFGGGFYDRWLKGFDGLTLGVCHEKLCMDFPRDEWDVPVKEVIQVK